QGGKVTINGDPTEGALLFAALKARIEQADLREQFTILKEYPFDSTRKMMSVIAQDDKGKKFVITKGAPDVLINQCESILWDDKQRILNNEHIEKVKDSVENLSKQALRTIAIAFKPFHSSTYPE